MPNQTILEQVRQPLATALSSVAGNVYAFVPETVIPPAVVVVPDSPYLEFETINKSNIRAKVNFTISVAVADSVQFQLISFKSPQILGEKNTLEKSWD